MKRPLLLLVTLALFTSTPALADRGDTWYGLGYSGSLPAGSFTQSARPGAVECLSITAMRSSHVSFGLEGGYHAWNGSAKANAMLEGFLGPAAGFKLSAVQTTAHIRVDILPAGGVRPYLRAGSGLYWVATTLDTPYGIFKSEREPKFGYHLGTGVDLDVNPNVAVGLGGEFHAIQPGHAGVNLFTAGVTLMLKQSAR